LITFITVIHVIVCIFLILVILLQAGKGGGMGAGLGGGGSQTVFGGRGSQSFLGRVTSVSAGIFMLTSVWLAYHSSSKGNESEVGAPPAAATQPAPAKGGAATPATPEQPKDATPPAQPGSPK
jgi:preprotein translocase subunit SecG